ncbi:Kinesin-like protein KIF14 [Holothuria leucospilota]|uniref:Kinesin-like protein KIF14 n=1 Tax=Holothuria leucospilota TaxID=206669 RepID=A0A9Q1H8D2_HOLLE|nr:Kinesin-like protein KIF14 [Holothuria leucospilota]
MQLSPLQGTLRRTLSNRTASNTPGNNVTPQHHVGRKYGKENRDQTKPDADATVFKTPTRAVKSAALKNTGTPECFNKVEMCTSTPGRLSRPSYDANEIDNNGFSVMVAVRVRPFNKREETDSDVTRVVSMSGNETTVTTSRGAGINSFCFDHCFWSFDDKNAPFASQQIVYEKVGQPLLYSALEGYHTCLFAYGQTGSGKSYTMMGDSDAKGIIPRFCEELFVKISKPEEENVKFMVEVSFFEIYNEKIHDLLADTNEKDQKKATLRVREHPSLGPYVEGLSVYPVSTFSDISRWIRAGNKQRATAATGMNDASSRSHSVFMIVLTKSKEGANINKSLMTLGKVISNLSDKSLNPKKKVFIPYRESVLTWLLKESLGGNSKTAMIATIGPASTNIEETMSTLRYAKQAESIINIPKVNEDPNARLVRELRAEIERLRLITKGSYDKQLDLDKIKNCQPNLVNLDENPQNDEVLVYLLKSGKNRICAETSASEGEESEEEKNQYCVIENANKLYCVKPGNAFQTLVNGREVRRQTFLNHGDRLIVGNSYYRFNHPEEVRKRRKRKGTSPSEDTGGIKFARNEIIEEQKRRMEEEISKMKQELEAEMEKKMKAVKKSSNEEAQEHCKQSEKQIADLQLKVNECQREIQIMERQKKEDDGRSATLMKEKTILLQQLQNVKNLFQTTMMPVIGVQRRVSSYHPKILAELEREKERMTQFIHNLPRKRISKPCTGGPDSKRRKSGPETRRVPIEEACLNHLKEKNMVSLDSTNMLDNVLLEMGKVYRTLSRFKEEGALVERCMLSFADLL